MFKIDLHHILRCTVFGSIVPLVLVVACVSAPLDPTGLGMTEPEEDRREARRLLMLSIDDYIDQTTRVQRIAERIRISNEELCGRQIAPILGTAVLNIGDLHPTLHALAIERFGQINGLHVLAVFDGMPAARGGLQVGDMILTIDGVRMIEMTRFSKLRISGDAKPTRVKVLRSGEKVELALPLEPGCRIPVSVRGSDRINAYNATQEIWITPGMLRIFDDDRIAFVIGHEIGHTIASRVLFRKQSGPKIEALADYIGLYLSVRAGFGLIDANLWEQLQRDLKSLDDDRGRTHPLTHERTLALRAAVAEVRQKMASGAPLEPELE